jgi:glycosyltransferase involved in cell wall biosynthesis
MKATLLVFAWNEIDGMRIIMPRIDRSWFHQILVVDGGSTDGTVEYCEDQGYEVFVQRAPGLGAAMVESLERITGDVIVAFSPDGNSIPERIPALLAKMEEGYDLVTVSRYLDGAKSEDDDAITGVANWFFTALVRRAFRAPLTDALVMFKAYRRDLFDDVRIDTNKNAWATQVLLRSIKRGKRLGEIPGDEPPRIGGVRKMQIVRFGIQEMVTLTREFLRPARR